MLTPDDIALLNTWRAIADMWERRAKAILQTVEHAIENRSMKGIDEMPAYQFNAQGIDPQYGAGGGGLPVGKHPVIISASELKPTQGGNGGYIAFTLEAIDGPSKGVHHTDRLNVYNQNAQTVEIANKQLAAYCSVVGVPGFNQTEELHGKPFVVEIRQQKNNPNYTEVAAIFDMNGNEPGKAGSGPQQQQQQQNGGFGNGGGFNQQPNNQQQNGGFGAQGGGTIPDQNQQPQNGQGGGFGGQQGQGGQGFGNQQQPQQNGQGGGGGGQWGQGGGQQGQGAGAGAGGGQTWQQGAGQGGGGGGGNPGWGQR